MRFRTSRLVRSITLQSIIMLSIAGILSSLLDAADGITATEVLIGQCAALTGHLKGLGLGMNLGLRAAFREANSKGGIEGRRIRLLAEDDGYEPEACVDCTAKMIEENGVFALAGYVGTPTAKVAAPMAQELKVPLVGLLSGAMLLRQPVLRYVVNLRASYDDETEALVRYLHSASGDSRIAVFYQNDSFGVAGLAGVEKALARRNLTLASRGSFERNTAAVRSGLAHIVAGNPDAVIIVAPSQPAAEFVRAAREAGLKSQLASISFVGVENLITDLGALADGIIVSEVLPSPLDSTLAVTQDYRVALTNEAPGTVPSYASFEGYIAGRVLLAAIARTGRDLSREKLIETFDGMSQLDIGGITFSFSAAGHQGSNLVFLTVVRHGRDHTAP